MVPIYIVPFGVTEDEYSWVRLGSVRAHGFFAICREAPGLASERQNKLKGSLGLGPFFDFQMLRLSGLAAQRCPRPTGHPSHCYVYCSLYYFQYYGVLIYFEGGGAISLNMKVPFFLHVNHKFREGQMDI